MVRRRAECEVAETMTLQVSAVEVGELTDAGFEPVTLHTNRGEIELRQYPVAMATQAVVCVGGVGGDFDTPWRGRLYPELCRRLQREDRILGVRVQYRHATDLLEATLDVLSAITYLEQQGIERVGLIGWSFGGAVVVQAAALSERVRTVVTIATQSYGIDPAADLGPRCSILLIHGQRDRTLPPHCSEYGHQIAREPKRLILHPEGNHGLDEYDELPEVVHEWVVSELGR